MCRDRLEALKGELSLHEAQAKQQSADRLQSLAAEVDRLEASARQGGEARCAAAQVGALCMPACLICAARLLMLHSRYGLLSRSLPASLCSAYLPACLRQQRICIGRKD